MSLWCCALFDVRREEQKSKQGIVSASMFMPILRLSCAKPRRDISVDPMHLELVDGLRNQEFTMATLLSLTIIRH